MEMLPKEENPVKQDEDVKFEKERLPDIESSMPEEKSSGIETTIPLKEDTMGTSDFPPLTDLEKQPKLPDESRIENPEDDKR